MLKILGKVTSVTLMIALVASFPLFAQTNGKIAGVVKDASSNDPLPGANVIIERTTLGATSDIQGRFFIINVPPGRHSVKATFMGYSPITKTEVLVRTDITTEVNFEMQTTAILGEAVTVVAERPLVEKTLTQSKTTVGAEELNNALPVGNYNDIVETAASTVQGYVRGGRKYETKYLVDGVDVSDTYFSGGTGAFGTGDVGHVYQSFRRSEIGENTVGNLPSSMIQEMSIMAGTFTAEYPTASAGVINLVTKTGGSSKYTGKLFVRGTPSDEWEHFGNNPYYMMNSDGDKVGYFDEKKSLEQSGTTKDLRAAQLFTWNQENARKNYFYDPDKAVGLGRSSEIEGNLSGPIPGLGDKAGFFLTGRYQNNRRSALPFDVDKRVNATMKMHYNLNPGQKITLYGQLDDGGKLFNFVNWKFNPHWLYYMEGAPRYQDLGIMTYAKWTHTLSPKTFYEVQVSQSNKTSWIGYPDDNGDGYSDLNETGDFIEFDTRAEYLKYLGGVTKTDENGVTYIDHPTVDGYTGNYLQDNPDAVLGPLDSKRTFFYSANDPMSGYDETKVNFYETGGSMRTRYPPALFSKTTRNVTTFKADLTSQYSYNHQIKTGAQFRLHNVDVDQKQAELGGSGRRYPTEVFHYDAHSFKPKEMAFYLQDRIEYQGLIVNLGARVDGYDNDTENFVNDFHPWNVVNDASGVLLDLQPSRGEKVGWKFYLSPRLGVSHPISERMAMHYSFGRFVQYPNFASLYTDYNYTNYSASPWMESTWPEQEPMTSTAYEIGMQWAPISDISLDANVYYRDVENYSTISWNLTPYAGQGVQFRTSWGHADSRGIELTLEKRRSAWWSARASYSYSYIKASQRKSGNDPDQRLNYSSKADSANFAGLPTESANTFPYREDNVLITGFGNPLAGGYDRTHRMASTVMFFLPQNIIVSAVGNFMSGFKYVQEENLDEDPWFDVSKPVKEGPWNYWINLRLSWEGNFGGIRIRPFAEVRNVTNKENVLAFDRNGFLGPQNQQIFELGQDLKPNTGDEQDPQGFWKFPYDLMGRPLFGPARQIWAGIEIGF